MGGGCQMAVCVCACVVLTGIGVWNRATPSVYVSGVSAFLSSVTQSLLNQLKFGERIMLVVVSDHGWLCPFCVIEKGRPSQWGNICSVHREQNTEREKRKPVRRCSRKAHHSCDQHPLTGPTSHKFSTIPLKYGSVRRFKKIHGQMPPHLSSGNQVFKTWTLGSTLHNWNTCLSKTKGKSTYFFTFKWFTL